LAKVQTRPQSADTAEFHTLAKKAAMNEVKLRIFGKVQGVFFRASTQEKARELGLKGWVKNEADGSVTAVAQGDAEAVKTLVKWCHDGPAQAKVSRVEIEAHRGGSFDDFSIVH
jgi:acylphosphatase